MAVFGFPLHHRRQHPHDSRSLSERHFSSDVSPGLSLGLEALVLGLSLGLISWVLGLGFGLIASPCDCP